MARRRRTNNGIVLWQRTALALLALLLGAVLLLRAFGQAPEEAAPGRAASPAPTLAPPAEPSAPAQTPPVTPEPTQAPPVTPEPAPADFSPPQGYSAATYGLVSDMVYSYRNHRKLGPASEETVQRRLRELNEADPALGKLWTTVMEQWRYARDTLPVVPGQIPEGLPEDESLALVVLGYQLLDDGSMDPELIARCEAALACAERYPGAYVIVSGGGTARDKKEISEAAVMAAWLRDRGIGEARLIVEEEALTTGDNARNVCALLVTRYPQIRQLLLVTSDYHMRMSWLLFSAEAGLYAYENGRVPYTLAGSVSCVPPKGTEEYNDPEIQAQYLWALLDPKY